MTGWFRIISVIYIFVCLYAGFAFCSVAFPKLHELGVKDFAGRLIRIHPLFVLLPVWFTSGTILVTWLVYGLAYLFQGQEQPLFYANTVGMIIALLLSVLTCHFLSRVREEKLFKLVKKKPDVGEIIFIVLVTGLAVQLMWYTFFVKAGELYVGYSVFSDFSAHLGMIRSFSYGNNFPTQYSHFAGQDIRYHFLFQFLVGNLEFLGMRIDYAFNIPSAIGLISAFSMLFVLAVKISGKRLAGYLSCLFFAFRSSESLFTFLSKVPKGTSALKALTENTEFIGYTPNENWGLWNLNVYCNQRHLGFALTILLFVLLLFLPHVYDMISELTEGLKIGSLKRMEQLEHKKAERLFPSENKEEKQEISDDSDMDYLFSVLTNKKQNLIFIRFRYCFDSLLEGIRFTFFTKEAWGVKNLRLSVCSGLLLGALAFWNGAVTIAALTILFVFAVFSKRKLEYLITAVIATALSLLQSAFFIQGSAVSFEILFGFLAENKTFFGVIDYIGRLLGILPVVLLLSFLIIKPIRKVVLFAFLSPLIFAFFVSLTIDITVNHKYIMISVMLLGIFAAIFIVQLLKQKRFLVRLVGVFLIIMLTCTGIYDYRTILIRNGAQRSFRFDLEDKLILWIKENASSQDIFLTHNYSLNEVVLGGAMLYLGWPYFGWSAGYDTDSRMKMVNSMYSASSTDGLRELVEENHIRYIIVDYNNRTSTEYTLNEDTIRNSYSLVYSDGEDIWNISIFDTKKPIS